MRKAVIVEDFMLIAEAWVSVLSLKDFDDIEICQSATELFEYLKNNSPELILMDINIKGDIDGIELTRKVKNDSNKIIILTTHNRVEFIESAFSAGADGFVTKNSAIKEISSAIDGVLSGKRYLCKELLGKYNIVQL